MKHIIRYLVCISGSLLIWVMMFGFNDSQNIFVGSVSAQTTPTCNSPSDSGCAEFCKTNSTNSVCQSIKISSLSKLARTLDTFLSFLYLIMWPLLYVAGLAMDNTMVYGEGLGLTGLLFQFWTLMRTFANFAIVFLIVYTIANGIFKPDQLRKDLGKTFIAIALGGILINFSWFLTGALVDISTIATYGVGAIPLKLEGDGAKYCDKDGKKLGDINSMDDIKKLGTCRPLLSTHGTMNLSDTFNSDAAQYKAYYSYKPEGQSTPSYFLTCPFKDGQIVQKEWDTFVQSFLSGGVASGTTTTIINTDSAVKDYIKNNQKYCVVGSNQLLKIEGNMPITMGSGNYYDAIVGGSKDVHSRNGLRIKNLVDSNKGMIGVMYTMYGNMLGFANIKTDVKTNSTESQIIQFMVKGFFGFAMLFPLIALCVVLVMRVAVLWLVIGFSPLFVLVWTLQAMGIKSLDAIVEPFKEKAKLNNIINLLFQPVVVVFVISMGMMFLDSLMSTLTVDNGFSEALTCNQFDPATGKQCCKVVDFVDICFEKFNAQVGTDAFFNYFTFAITNIIGVMLLWFMVFAVIKSNKITKGAVDKIEGLGRNMLGSMPVIPWFDGNMVGYDGAKAGLGSARDKITDPTKDKTGESVTQPWVDNISDQITGKVSGAQQSISKSVADIDTKTLESTDGRKAFGEKLIGAINEQSKKVQHATANELVDKNDPKIKALLSQYGASDALDLLSNPKFIAETGKDSNMYATAFAVSNDKWIGAGESKKEYFKSLAAQAKKLPSLGKSSSKVVIEHDNRKYIYERTIKEEGGRILEASLKKTENSLPTKSSYVYDDVKGLSGNLSKDELIGLIGSNSGANWEIGVSQDPKNTMATIVEKKAPEPKPASPTPDASAAKNKDQKPSVPVKNKSE